MELRLQFWLREKMLVAFATCEERVPIDPWSGMAGPDEVWDGL